MCVCLRSSLEVTLQKLEEGSTWPELVPGDGRGEYVVSEEQAALVHERLSYLTVDELVRDARTHTHTVRIFA